MPDWRQIIIQLSHFALSESSTLWGLAALYIFWGGLAGYRRFWLGHNGVSLLMMLAFFSLAAHSIWLIVCIIPPVPFRWDSLIMKFLVVTFVTAFNYKIFWGK